MCCDTPQAALLPRVVAAMLDEYRARNAERPNDWGDEMDGVARGQAYTRWLGSQLLAAVFAGKGGNWPETVRGCLSEPLPAGLMVASLGADGGRAAGRAAPYAIPGGAVELAVLLDSQLDRATQVEVDGSPVAVAAGGVELITLTGPGARRVCVGSATAPAGEPAAPARLRLRARGPSRWSVVDDHGGAWFPQGRLRKWDFHDRPMVHLRTVRPRVGRLQRLGGQPRRHPPAAVTHVPSFFSDWSPDGQRIAFDFVDDTGVHIATMDPNGRNVRQLTFGSAIQEIPDWSPDGRRIAFNAAPVFPGEPGFHTDIWIMRADGSHKRQLTSGAFDDEPVFSPDGRRIAFGRRTQDAEIPEVAIYVMSRDGTHQRQVVPETLGLAHHDWSPDGRWIAFQIAPELPNGGIMAVRPDGSGLHVIRRNNNRWEVYKPTWSPDGRKLLVVCFDVQAQIEKLCTMNPNGRNLQVVVATPDFVNFPAWGTHPPKH